MSGAEILNCTVLGMAIILFSSSVVLLRPANGSRPLLIGFMASALFGVVVAATRTFSLQSTVRPYFGVLTFLWLSVKLWAIWAAALRTNRPFRYMAGKFWRRAWGMADP